MTRLPEKCFFSLLLFLIASQGFSQEAVYKTEDGVQFRVEVVLSNLEIPWSLVFGPNGDLYFTERPGRLQVLRAGSRSPMLIAELEEVVHRGEGGLMGLALHPNFSQDSLLYVSYTYRARDGLRNRVVRYRLRRAMLAQRSVIVDELPGARFHNGCRLRFGPDGKLYVTTGDATDRQIAQDLQSLGGKILRVNDDGSVPSDNPFRDSPIYAFGSRNAQGIDWHPGSGLLFETEHGPSGFDGPGGGDEVNIIEAGKNYGWPTVHHRQRRKGMVSPLLEYTPAVAPGSGTFYRGDLIPKFKENYFFGALRGQHIHRIVLDPSNPRKVSRTERLLEGEFRRIRDVAEGLDGAIYFCTSNRDGRARPFEDDDRILRIVPVR